MDMDGPGIAMFEEDDNPDHRVYPMSPPQMSPIAAKPTTAATRIRPISPFYEQHHDDNDILEEDDDEIWAEPVFESEEAAERIATEELSKMEERVLDLYFDPDTLEWKRHSEQKKEDDVRSHAMESEPTEGFISHFK